MSHLEQSIQLKNKLDSFRPLKKDDELRIMQKFRLDWNYHSNNIEGNSLSYGETKALILFGITAQGKPLKDHFEITGHDEAIKWVMDIVKEKKSITEKFIRELHILILKESYEVNAISPDGHPTKKKINVGVYKTTPNHVKTQTGEIFRFATPEETPAKMHDLIEWYRAKSSGENINPILLASEFHYRYIRIHPFDDGNGRTARILMNFILMRFGYPPVIIKTEDKQNYFSALRQADAGLLESFIEYIASNLNRSLELMIKGAEGKNIDDPDDLDKEISLLEQKLLSKGEKVEHIKNKENVKKIIENSLMPLLHAFEKKNKKFNNFYLSHSITVWIDRSGFNIIDFYLSQNTILNLNEELPYKIGLESLHEKFNNSNVDPFDYTTMINVHFEDFKYYIANNKRDVLIEKFYDEYLDKEEIESILKHETDKHLEHIKKESKIN